MWHLAATHQVQTTGMVGTMQRMGQDEPISACKHVRRRHVPRSLARRGVGWSMIALALLGFLLPILPGIVFLAIGIVILGPHDPTLRRAAVWIRLALRRWSQIKQRHLRAIGSLARARYRQTRLALRVHLHRHQSGTVSWRAHWLLLAVMLLGMAAAASAMLVVWHVVL
jgi:transposase